MALNINIKEAIQDLKNLISLASFRKLLTYSMITTTSFYLTSISLSSINLNEPGKTFENYTVLKFIAVSIAVDFVFYRLPRFVLRNFFHVYIRNKFQKKQIKIRAAGKYRSSKDMHEIYTGVKFIIKNYLLQLGYFSVHDVKKEDITITERVKDELLNEMLLDCYKWICTIIHFIITLCFIWNFLNVYLIIGCIIVLLVFLLVPFVAILLVMNLELLTKLIVDIIKEKEATKYLN